MEAKKKSEKFLYDHFPEWYKEVKQNEEIDNDPRKEKFSLREWLWGIAAYVRFWKKKFHSPYIGLTYREALILMRLQGQRPILLEEIIKCVDVEEFDSKGLDFDIRCTRENPRRCYECGVREGKVHKPGCDWEECPFCHWQLISCNCVCELLGVDPDEWLTNNQEKEWNKLLRKKGLIRFGSELKMKQRI